MMHLTSARLCAALVVVAGALDEQTDAMCSINEDCAMAASGSSMLQGSRVLQTQNTPVSAKYGDDTTSPAGDSCPNDYFRIIDEMECRAAMPFIEGGDPDGFNGASAEADWPRGCYSCKNAEDCSDGVWFNSHSTGADVMGAKPVCKKGEGALIEKGGTVFVGDSDVDYWHTFQKAVPGAYNVGIGGQTCKNVINEISAILASFEPSTVVLVCGENDLSDAGVGTTYSRWKSVVQKISKTGARIVMMGTKPEADTKHLHREYRKYDAKVRQFVISESSKAPAMVFVDSYKAFVAMDNKDSFYDPSEKPDYLHLGPEGYGLWNGWLKNGLSYMFGCVVWNGDRCEATAPLAALTRLSTNECPAGYEKIKTEAQCAAASGLVKLSSNKFHGSEISAEFPSGCYHCKGVEDCSDGIWFNEDPTGKVVEGAHVHCVLKQ